MLKNKCKIQAKLLLKMSVKKKSQTFQGRFILSTFSKLFTLPKKSTKILFKNATQPLNIIHKKGEPSGLSTKLKTIIHVSNFPSFIWDK
jgi:hypothetical protein